MSPNIPPLPNLQPAAKNETLSIVHGIYAGLLVLVRLHFISGISAVDDFHAESGYCVATFSCADCFEYSACLKVKQGNGSGRTLSRIMAILMLLSFPIGTVLGVIALWKSVKINGSNKSSPGTA